METIVSRFLSHAVFLSFVVTATSVVFASQVSARYHADLPESWARKSALNAVLPIYPDEAARRGIAGVVRIKFETNPEGKVVKIKVKPLTDSLLKKAVVESVKQWRFRPWPGQMGVDEIVFSRLAFNFIIDNGEPRVEMYDPGRHPPEGECLGCTNSAKELREWNEWEEAWSSSEPDGLDAHPTAD